MDPLIIAGQEATPATGDLLKQLGYSQAVTARAPSIRINLDATAINLSTGSQGKPTGQIQLFRQGVFMHWMGAFTIDEVFYNAIERNFSERTIDSDLTLDYGHSDDPRDTAGWILKLLRRAGDLWAEVEFEVQAAEDVKGGKIKYISSSFWRNYERPDRPGTDLGPVLAGAALTNRPFIDGMGGVVMNSKDSAASIIMAALMLNGGNPMSSPAGQVQNAQNAGTPAGTPAQVPAGTPAPGTAPAAQVQNAQTPPAPVAQAITVEQITAALSANPTLLSALALPPTHPQLAQLSQQVQQLTGEKAQAETERNIARTERDTANIALATAQQELNTLRGLTAWSQGQPVQPQTTAGTTQTPGTPQGGSQGQAGTPAPPAPAGTTQGGQVQNAQTGTPAPPRTSEAGQVGGTVEPKVELTKEQKDILRSAGLTGPAPMSG